MIGMLWLARSCSLGTSFMPSRGSAGWKTSPLCAASWWATKTAARGGGRGPMGGPEPGDDVPRCALGRRPAAEPEPAAADVVVDRRGGESAHERGREAPEHRRQRGAGVQDAERP